MNRSDEVAEDAVLAGFYDALLEDDAERLYEHAPCGYLTTSPDGLILKANTTFLTMTGYTRPELLERYTFAQLLTPGGQIYHETHYAPMLRMQGTAREIALDVVASDGTRLPVLVNAVMDRNAAGEPGVVRIAVFDARQRRAYEQELLRAKELAEASEQRARSLARTLQQTLIPPTPPAVPGLEVGAAYRPAGHGEEVGGDFYDVFQVAADDWVVAIGDVCGKGVDAAVVTALVRYTLRAAAVEWPRPSAALAHLNGVLLEHGADRFCTVGMLRLRRVDGRWTGTTSSGGHALPLLRREGERPAPVGTAGSLLGVFEDAAFTDVDVPLSAGDVLVLYTDGVPEARRGSEFYGDERLLAAVAGAGPSAEALTQTLLDGVLAFQSGVARDDIAIVAVRVP